MDMVNDGITRLNFTVVIQKNPKDNLITMFSLIVPETFSFLKIVSSCYLCYLSSLLRQLLCLKGGFESFLIHHFSYFSLILW